jgi:sugar lactone lactonase YvrE
MRLVCVVAAVLVSTAAFAESLTVTIFAGSDGGGYRDGIGNAARLGTPWGLAVDANGDILVADGWNTIRHVTPSGVVTTFAGLAGVSGTANGPRGAARFTFPRSIAVDRYGNVYVADEDLRKISPGGVVTTVVRSLSESFGRLAVDSSGNVFLPVYPGSTIKKITPDGSMTTFVSLSQPPIGLTIDSSNNLYFITDDGGIYKCTPLGVITPFAMVPYASSLKADAAGNLYVTADNRILKVAPGGTVTLLAGSVQQGQKDGTGSDARFTLPTDVALSPDGSSLYVGDYDTIRKITLPEAVVTTLAGKPRRSGSTDATGLDARFEHPSDVVLAPDDNLYVADLYTIRKITPAGVTSTFVGGKRGKADGTGRFAQFITPTEIAYGYEGNDWVLYVTDNGNDNVRKITRAGVVSTVATGIDGAFGVAVAADGDVYVSEYDGHTIKKIDMPSAIVTVFAGVAGMSGMTNATGPAARFRNPAGLAIDGSGNLFVADQGNRLIRQIALSTAEVTTLAGNSTSPPSDGTGTAASFGFYGPERIHAVGSDLYVVASQSLRLIKPGAVVTTVAGRLGSGYDGIINEALWTTPAGIGGDSSTNLYICDRHEYNIRKARIPGIADVATASDTTPRPHTVVQLETVSDGATSWTWSLERRPTGSSAELSSTTIRNPTFTPDVADLYTFLLRAEGPGGLRYSTLNVQAETCPDPLRSVVASIRTASICTSARNSTAMASVIGGMGVTYQWGYRTAPGGEISHIGIPTTSAAYTIDGSSFIGTGQRWLVVTATPSCGLPMVSNELPFEVTPTPNATLSVGKGVFANSTRNVASVPDAGAGATYVWSMTNGIITAGLGTRSIEYTAGASGTVALTVTVGRDGCASAFGKADIPIHPLPARRRSSRT